MTTTWKTKSRFEQLLSEIYAMQSRENTQKVCIDCLKLRSNKNKFEFKNCGCTDFYVLGYQNSSFEILTKFVMVVLSKIKTHSDAINLFKEPPFYNKPIKKPKVKRLINIDRLAELPFYE